ncbi:efflux RND transporter periplasmic adaptor subunit [Butyrivibrio sp. CB08]|uniref:efflux RND transporter periplasmic adaptor subunit n=1 Tax=Butyrivibrio sp. CB08 TaxID=2364879 RepID=UPI000EAA3D07|nr:efflux RND transporter periplasmic adaptor subunit [Butyrivibrio sp. CB08]RKM61345.1 efflux RND transporter periplasmic adaptor subunit [Butyrivibrio sp. CB08]
MEENKNEIKETTVDAVEIYDEDDSVDLSDSVKKKKKFKKRYIVIGVAALALIGFIVFRVNASKNAVTFVETQEVALGSIENILSISGTVESGETKNYFSELAAPIDKVNVKVGDKVKAGDVLCTFDAENLDLQQQSAELAIKQAKGSYSSLYSPTGAADRKYAEGMTAQQINDRIDAITAEIDAINRKITEKSDRMNQTLTDLQKTARDINQNGISDSSEMYFDNGNDGYIYRNQDDTKTDGNYNEPSESNKQMSLAIQDSISDVSYAIQHDPEIEAWNNQITALKEEQSHLSSAKAAQVNPGTAQSQKASLESTELTQGNTLSKIESAREGIKAEFNGVITAIPATVVDGATVANGAQLLTIANLDDVQISIQVSKSDLPKVSVGEKVDITINGKSYQGEVTKISGSATKNSNGVAVVDTKIKVTNPDSDIILGVEANNKIHAQKADDTIVLPYEIIQTDSTGDYVYVLDNGVVARRDVTIGISTSTDAQIVEGLSVGDQVISSDVSMLTEGMAVSVMPVQ